ncbi:hypothetical protein F5Y12DRAFT_267570 [Xylaria sp. FL1777]|nr:hypothetical protein F5Y12DRAFT_267570 [Xylaria sp. FL1777]
MMTDDICPACGESKNPANARFEHRRPGLDEPPEPDLRKCIDAMALIKSISNKVAFMSASVFLPNNMTMELMPYPNPNMVTIESMSMNPIMKVNRMTRTIVPGYTLAVLDEYGFDGVIRNPTYTTSVKELSGDMMVLDDIRGVNIKTIVMARMYKTGDKVSYTFELEFL